MIVRRLGGIDWYLTTAHYPTAEQAKVAWERVERRLTRLRQRRRGASIGVTRLAPGGMGRSCGAPADAHVVIALSRTPEIIEDTARQLRDGAAWTPVPDFLDALIARRLRVELANPEVRGRLVARRPEGRGAQLSPDGVMRDPVGDG